MKATVGSQIIGNAGLLAITVGCWDHSRPLGLIVGGLLCVATAVLSINKAKTAKEGAASDSDTGDTS